jgi:hypothetical protein
MEINLQVLQRAGVLQSPAYSPRCVTTLKLGSNAVTTRPTGKTVKAYCEAWLELNKLTLNGISISKTQRVELYQRCKDAKSVEKVTSPRKCTSCRQKRTAENRAARAVKAAEGKSASLEEGQKLE